MKFTEIAPKLIEMGYKLPVPIKPGTKYPGFPEWQNFRYDAFRADAYSGYGTGLICGSIVGVDIDCYERTVTEQLRNLAQRMLGPTIIRIGSPPKELLVYRTATPFDKNSTHKYQLPLTPKVSQVEALCHGQQFVAFAIHPDTGNPYTWVADESPLTVRFESLPEIDSTKLSIFIQMADEILAAAAGVAPAVSKPTAKSGGANEFWPLDAGKAALELIGLQPGERDRWRNIAWALKEMCGDQAFAVFNAWSSGQPDYTGQEDCYAVWDSDRNKPSGITRATLIKAANEAAKTLKKDDPKAKTWNDARSKHLKAQHAAASKSASATLESELVFVTDQSKFWCVPRQLWMDDNAIRQVYTAAMPVGLNGMKDDPIRLLRESATKTVVNAKNYWPGQPRVFSMNGQEYLNEYVDPQVAPIPPTDEERATWKWFYERTFGQDADGKLFGPWFLSLLAYRVQQPGAKLYKASLIHSPIAGNGKSTWSLFLPRLILGASNVGEPRHAMLEGQFNDFFAGKQIVHLDEIRFGGGRVDATKVMDNLKTPIDSDVLTINAKFQRPYAVRNIAWVTATSNRSDALAIDDSERRWGVFELKVPALSMEERKRLFTDWLNTERGPGTLKALLLEHDLSGFDPMMDPPETEAKLAMRRSSEPVQIQLLREGLEGSIRTPLFDRDLVLTSALCDFVNERAQYSVTASQLGRLLANSSLGFESCFVTTSMRRQRARIIRNHGRWASATEQERGRYLETGEG